MPLDHPRNTTRERRLTTFSLRLFVGLVGILSLTGCVSMKPSLPKLPKVLQKPETEVARVDLVERSNEASRYFVTVILKNPNDYPLPLTHASYSLKVAGGMYAGDTVPNATLPANGTVSVQFSAAVPGGGEGAYDTSGSIQIVPPGKIRELMYELGVPIPRVGFSGTGNIVTALKPKKESTKIAGKNNTDKTNDDAKSPSN